MMKQPWKWPEENGVIAETDTYTPETIRTFEVLRRWFFAMESGEAALWQPDPDYPREFTEKQVNDVIMVALDEWFELPANANYAKNQRKFDFDAGPEFRRLAFPQRLALVQQLVEVLEPGPSTTPVQEPNSGLETD